jgi:excisionase family DNA binding protein
VVVATDQLDLIAGAEYRAAEAISQYYAAAVYKVHPQTIYAAVRSGKITAHKPGRIWRIWPDDLRRSFVYTPPGRSAQSIAAIERERKKETALRRAAASARSAA